MEELASYIYPALSALMPILYGVGYFLKKSKAPDWTIPFILGLAGIVLATSWLLVADFPQNGAETVKTVAAGIVQGVLCASVAVYSHNLIKQYKEKES